MQKAKLPPGPPPVKRNPWSMLSYFRSFRKDPIAFISRRFDEFGDIYRATFGSSSVYILRHPEHMRQVLVTNAGNYQKTQEGNVARQLKRFLGNGLLSSDGKFWRRQRRMIQPAFMKKRIEGYSQIMIDATGHMLETWRSRQKLDVSEEMMYLTLCIVNKALFDHDIADDASAHRMLNFRRLAATPQILPNWLSFRYNKRNKEAVEAMDEFVYGLIESRRQSNDGQDLLSVLLAAVDTEGDQRKMTERELRNELLTLYFAGHDTTSHALTWTLYLLSQNREVEARLFREIDSVLGDRPPTVEDLKELSYTEMVLCESMRLFPPAYAVSRTAKGDDEIGGYRVPAGTELVMWIYLAHHDPRWFPQPEKFDPERFSPENRKQLPQCAHMPFGAGARICIGKEFAMMEAKLILAMIAQQFSLTLAEGCRVAKDFAITLAPKHGMPMLLHARRGAR